MENVEETGVVAQDGADPPPTQRFRSRTLRYVIPAVVLVAVVFGAGIFFGRSAGPGTAAQPTPSRSSADPRYAQAMVFVNCLREKGITNYPDAQPDGELLISNQTGIDIGSKSYQAAENACRQYLPKGLSQGQGEPSQQAVPPSGGASQAPFAAPELRTYVNCIRDKGVTQFPDPDSQGNFRNVDPDWPGLQAAQAACAKFLPSGAPGAPK
jgi:hypothetical protein